jgi:hypothetical protein
LHYFKELLSLSKLRKAHVEAADESSQIRTNKIKSESTVTTETFINEQMFIETEFLPTKPRRMRLFQVNMVLMRSVECGMLYLFPSLTALKRFCNRHKRHH